GKQGIRDALHHPRTILEGSGIGIVFGMIPGVGAASAQFLAYGRARLRSKDKGMFGRGAVEGVIAADAATNSVEGGAMIPTLAFAIPGTSVAAILMAGFFIHGIDPGPEMLTTHLSYLWLVIWILVFS